MDWLEDFVHLEVALGGVPANKPNTTDGWHFVVRRTADFDGLRRELMTTLAAIIALNRIDACYWLSHWNTVAVDMFGTIGCDPMHYPQLAIQRRGIISRICDQLIVMKCDRFHWKSRFLTAQQAIELLQLVRGFDLTTTPAHTVPSLPPKPSDEHVVNAIVTCGQQNNGIRNLRGY